MSALALLIVGLNLAWTASLTAYTICMFAMNQQAWDKNIEAWEGHMKHRHAA